MGDCISFFDTYMDIYKTQVNIFCLSLWNRKNKRIWQLYLVMKDSSDYHKA